MDRRQSSGMEGESQEMKEYGPCVEGQTHPGSPPDPSRKSSRSIQEVLLCEKTAASCESNLAGMDTPEPRFRAKGHSR